MTCRIGLLTCALVLAILCADSAVAQQAPGIAYIFPPGGRAGETYEVRLGGYDWTPDMQLFALDPDVTLEMLAPPGPVIVPEPPYWFGKKARRGAFPLPREIRARLTIPANAPPGMLRWQAANANGATGQGYFVVTNGREVLELDGRAEPQQLASLPVTISGQIKKIAQVDQFAFTSARSGPVTCSVAAHAMQSPLMAVVEVHDDTGRRVADVADTEGRDCSLTFSAAAGRTYTISLFDVDFRGDRSFVYRLSVEEGPRVVAVIPAAGRRGETRLVKFVGYGVATGAAQLESTTREVVFPTDESTTSFLFVLKTAHGAAAPFRLLLSNLAEIVESVGDRDGPFPLNVPSGVTGVIDSRAGEDRYQFEAQKEEVWVISLQAARIGSPLDGVLSVFDATGKELARADDLPDSTDAELIFTAPASGAYLIAVSDVSGKRVDRASIYRLTVQQQVPDYSLDVPGAVNLPLGGKIELVIKATRTGGFDQPIGVSLSGLPSGVTVPDEITIPSGESEKKIELVSAADATVSATLVRVTATASLDGSTHPRRVGNVLVTIVMQPPFTLEGEGKDDVTKWPRGSTFPAPVIIERADSFDGEVVLEMSSAQGRHRQGITGPELTVPRGVERVLYPIFLPEWLETTRTSRLVLNGVAQVPDPQGNLRYLLQRQKSRIGFLPEGALLKIYSNVTELEARPGKAFDISLTISRSPQLPAPARLDLLTDDRLADVVSAAPVTAPAEQKSVAFRIDPATSELLVGEIRLTIRATVMQQEEYPVTSETSVLVDFGK